MEIEPKIPTQAWIDDADAAAAASDSFVNDAFDLLASTGFWGTVLAVGALALKFVPQLAPQYGMVAKMVGAWLAPKVHQDKMAQVEQYAQHYVTTVKVIEDVGNQLPDSNGVQNLKALLKKVTDSDFHNAVATITKDVHPNKPEVEIIINKPSSASQILAAVN